MKYTNTNQPLVCMMTDSTCYKETSKMTIKGILWHSTGANNPNLRRYVQPSENDANYHTLMAKLGKNNNGNSWNDIYVEAGLNAWIGKLADGTVTTVQTMPWDYKPWGCGGGPNGSCNNGWIQFEICEDGLNDKAYFDKVYKEACELTAYLCKKYNLNPGGWTTCGNTKCPVILCHDDSHGLGLGSNHGDVNHWFPKFGKSMDTVRADVAALMTAAAQPAQKPATPAPKPTPAPTVKPGDVNGDGKINTLDAQKIFAHTSGKVALTGNELKAADYNQDGQVNTIDALEAFAVASGKKAEAETYRIRKTWADAASQKGAFTDLANAKKCCDEAGAGYEVYDSKGTVVYAPATNSKPATTTTPKALKVGDTCKLISGAKFTSGEDVPNWVINSTLYVREISSDDTVVISTLKTGAITGRVHKKYIQGAVAATTKPFSPYVVIVTVAKLNVRSGPGTNYSINTTISKNGAYTIVEEQNGWGKLKSGAGWIALEYTTKH